MASLLPFQRCESNALLASSCGVFISQTDAHRVVSDRSEHDGVVNIACICYQSGACCTRLWPMPWRLKGSTHVIQRYWKLIALRVHLSATTCKTPRKGILVKCCPFRRGVHFSIRTLQRLNVDLSIVSYDEHA